jgi:hypothetical protein
MKPLEAELALSYCRQARESVARVAGILPLAAKNINDERERALFCLAELERRIKRAVQGQR